MTKSESMAIAAIGALTKAGHLLPIEVTGDDIKRGIEALAAEVARLTDTLKATQLDLDLWVGISAVATQRLEKERDSFRSANESAAVCQDHISAFTETDSIPCLVCHAGGLETENERLTTALTDILAVSKDRERFVMMGPRGWAEAERIAEAALLPAKEES